jgi:hypothetical protein
MFEKTIEIGYHNQNNSVVPTLTENKAISDLIQEINTVDKEYHPFIISNRKDSLNTLSVHELVQICTHFNHNNHDSVQVKLLDTVTDNIELWIITHILEIVQKEYSSGKWVDEKEELITNKIQELYTNNLINNKHLFTLFLVMNFQDETCIGEWVLCQYKSDNFLHTLNELVFTSEKSNQFWQKMSAIKSHNTHIIDQTTISLVDIISEWSIYKN